MILLILIQVGYFAKSHSAFAGCVLSSVENHGRLTAALLNENEIQG